jgi:hypothetical protein
MHIPCLERRGGIAQTGTIDIRNDGATASTEALGNLHGKPGVGAAVKVRKEVAHRARLGPGEKRKQGNRGPGIFVAFIRDQREPFDAGEGDAEKGLGSGFKAPDIP